MTAHQAAEAYIRDKYSKPVEHSLIDMLVQYETPVFVAGCDWHRDEVIRVIEEHIAYLNRSPHGIINSNTNIRIQEMEYLKKLFEK